MFSQTGLNLHQATNMIQAITCGTGHTGKDISLKVSFIFHLEYLTLAICSYLAYLLSMDASLLSAVTVRTNTNVPMCILCVYCIK